MKKPHPFAQFGYIVSWLGLCVLAALLAWQLHITTLYLATLMVNSPLRPPGWHSGSVALLSRLSIVIWGSLWLIFIYYIEYTLRESIRYHRLLRRSGTYGAILLIIYAIAYLIVIGV